jgi:phage regulator Rha-like protein
MNLMTNNEIKTMNSREIAELTGKQHKDVLYDVRKMLLELNLTSADFSLDLPDSYGRMQTAFKLPKRECLILVSGYSIAMRAKIIDRWQELEQVNSMLVIPNFSNPAEAARAWALEYEARIKAEATKAEIGSRREATAMNTASQATKKANRLEIELDRSKEYATIKRMEMLYHGMKFSWRLLKSTSLEMNVETIEVFDQNYGKVKAYHASVWQEAYALPIILPTET